MALAGLQTPHTVVKGCFRNEYASFEYMEIAVDEFIGAEMKARGYTHEIFMSDGSRRYARILKTVAYVAIDEDEFGNPIDNEQVNRDAR